MSIVFISGGTGNQGGPIVQAALQDKRFSEVRTLTRNKNSDKAKSLSAQGVKVFEGSFDDAASLSLALQGVDTAFLVTQFWEKLDVELEVGHGRTFVDTAKAAGVSYLVFSTLDNEEQFDVPHFRSKTQIEKYISSSGLEYSFVKFAFYFENFLSFFPPRHDEEKDVYTVAYPTGDHKIPMAAVADGGSFVVEVLANRKEYSGKTYRFLSENLSGPEVASTIQEVTGKSVVFYPISVDDFKALGFPGADDLGEMFKLLVKLGPADASHVKKVDSKVRSFKQWVEDNKELVIPK